MPEDEKEEPVTLSEAEAETARAKAEFEEAKAEAEEAKPDDGTLRQATISDAVVASEAAAKAEATYEAAKAQVGEVDQAGKLFTNKRKQERIFRREMGEPEFFLDKEDRFPKPILSEEEKDDITRKALNYEDTTPTYDPQNILDERYGGTSNYETGITVLGDELQAKLDRLKNDPEALTEDIEKVEQDLSYLDSLHENYYLGMNVFTTAKGGREKLRD